MDRWKALLRQSRTGLLMQDGDLAELYSYLKLFQNTYCICEQETDQLLKAIRDLYMLQSGVKDAEEALKGLKNPRNAGRKKTITEEQCHTVRELHDSGMTIREITANTGLSKSSVQRVLKKGVSHN